MDTKNEKSKQLFTQGNLNRAIWVLSIPMVLEMAMESVFAVADMFFLGKVGTDAVAAVGLTEALLWVIYAIAIGLAVSTTALVARRIGEREPEKAALSAVQANWMAILVSIPITVIGILFAKELLMAMGSTSELADYGSTYLTIAFTCNIVIILLFVNNAVFRGAGDARTAMWSLGIANGINLILDPCLIFGLGPFPELGLTGAAVASVIGRGTGVLYQVYMLFRSKGSINLSVNRLGIRFNIMLKLGRLSLGGIMQQLVESASWIILVRIIAAFGPASVAGYTIALRILSFAYLPAWGLANAAATLVGQNLGAQKPGRAERAVWFTGGYAASALFLVMLLFIPLGESLIGIFSRAPDVILIGEQCLRIISYGYIFFAIGMVLAQSFNGAGDTTTPMWLNIMALWFVKIPLAYLLAYYLEMNTSGVFTAITVSYSLHAILAFLLFNRGRWKNIQV